MLPSFQYFILHFLALGHIRTDHNDEWSWLNHGRYFHSCETFPMEIIPEEGASYYQQAIIAAGKSYLQRRRS